MDKYVFCTYMLLFGSKFYHHLNCSSPYFRTLQIAEILLQHRGQSLLQKQPFQFQNDERQQVNMHEKFPELLKKFFVPFWIVGITHPDNNHV